MEILSELKTDGVNPELLKQVEKFRETYPAQQPSRVPEAAEMHFSR